MKSNKKQRYCKYCGVKIQMGSACGGCSTKLKLIRTIQKMIRDTVERKGTKMSDYITNEEHCVCCGQVIPEGRQVCFICGLKTNYKQPAADVVEVVHCKDCAYFKQSVSPLFPETNCFICDCVYGLKSNVGENDFCSYGERKDGKNAD